MHIVVHYDEIALKGKNRSMFENLLVNNIIKKIGKVDDSHREYGQIIITLNNKTEKELEDLKSILNKIPGISYFSYTKKTGLEMEEIKKEVIDFIADKKYETFRIFTQRHNKEYKLDSMEINKIIGKLIVDKFKKKVSLDNAELTIKIEISDKCAYLSSEDIPGIGGLPTNQKQKVVALLSGGFDSPVAAYSMMKRGCEVILVHFNNKNQVSSSVKNKILELAKQLSKFQTRTKLYILPFEDMQKEIISKVHSELRMLIYRRFMIKIASIIAEENGARFLVTGDSLCQVASQTFENLSALYETSEKHILSPLIGTDKKDIIDMAKKIGTYDISTQPYGDCCSFFIASHPKLNAKSSIIKKIEEKIENKVVEETVNNAQIIDF